MEDLNILNELILKGQHQTFDTTKTNIYRRAVRRMVGEAFGFVLWLDK